MQVGDKSLAVSPSARFSLLVDEETWKCGTVGPARAGTSKAHESSWHVAGLSYCFALPRTILDPLLSVAVKYSVVRF